jgi:hypothetical protein
MHFLVFLSSVAASSTNIFNNLPYLAPASLDIGDELDCYLATDTEDVWDGLMWWHERHAAYPYLSHMARDYLSIPGTFLYLFHPSNC